MASANRLLGKTNRYWKQLGARPDLLVYLASMFVATGSGFLRTAILSRIMTPMLFGQYSLSLMMTTLGTAIATFGFTDTMYMEVPRLLGLDRNQDAVATRNRILSSSFVIAAALGVLSTAILLACSRWSQTSGAISLTGILLITMVPFNLFVMDLRCRTLLPEAGKVLMLKSVTSLVLGCVGATLIGVPGAIAGESVGTTIACIYLLMRYSKDYRFVLPRLNQSLSTVRMGAPFSVSTLLQNFSFTIGNWFLLFVYGAAALGQYAFAMVVYIIGVSAIDIMGQYFGPRLLSAHSRHRSMHLTQQRVHRLVGLVALLFAIVALPFYLGFRFVVQRYYPHYLESLSIMPFVYGGTMFSAMMNFYDVPFYADSAGGGLLNLNLGVLAGLAIIYAALTVVKPPLYMFGAVFCFGRLVMLLGKAIMARRLMERTQSVTG